MNSNLEFSSTVSLPCAHTHKQTYTHTHTQLEEEGCYCQLFMYSSWCFGQPHYRVVELLRESVLVRLTIHQLTRKQNPVQLNVTTVSQ